MMKVPKTDGLDQILESINSELDSSRKDQITHGSINKWNLKINDLNKEAEYQDCKHKMENVWIKRLLFVLILIGLLETSIRFILWLTIELNDLGILFYLGLFIVSLILY